jgi:hypothetical protein
MGEGADMFSDEFLTAIKAEREREIKAAQRARLADRNRLEDEPDGGSSQDKGRSIGRIVRPSVQPGRTRADPSL